MSNAASNERCRSRCANTAANHANNGAKDWRQCFFFKKNTSTGNLYWLDNNTVLFDPNGSPAIVAHHSLDLPDDLILCC